MKLEQRRCPPVSTRAIPAGAVAALLAASALALAGCEEEPGLSLLEVSAVFEPAALDFGEVTVGTAKGLPVVFRNDGQIGFTVDDVIVPDDFTIRGLKAQLLGGDLPPGGTVEFDVVFVPLADGARSEVLSIRLGSVSVDLRLTGSGTQRRVAQLVLDPTALDFGSLPLGTMDRRTVQVLNRGTGDATITEINLNSSMGPAQAGTIFASPTALPLTVPAGGSASADVTFVTTLAANLSETLLFVSPDVLQPLQLPVRGRGAEGLGGLACTPPSIDFGAVERGQTGMARVTCTAEGGPARILRVSASDAVQFDVTGAPANETLARGRSVEFPVLFNASGTLGSRAGAILIDYEGSTGMAQLRIQLLGRVTEPPPTATAVSLELTWNTNLTDVDLHLVGPRGTLFGVGDCYFGRRNADFGALGDTSDDCFLDQDDVDGRGPERINMTRAAPGTYLVYVHYYTDNLRGPSDANVVVTLSGQRAGVFNRPGLRCNDMWLVGEIQWTGTAGTFSPVDVVTRARQGQCL